MPQLTLPSPLGYLTITAADGALTSLTWGPAPTQAVAEPDPVLAAAAEQLVEWFERRRTAFSLPLAPAGTPFQRRVWGALAAIPYGATVTYGGLARDLANAARAVGAACGRNPLPIVIPCHRVVGVNGLCGYSGPGGLGTKAWLLDHERS